MLKKIAILASLFALSSPSFGQVKVTEMIAESDEESSLVTLKYSGAELKKIGEVEEHSTFLQITIPNASSEKVGEFLDGNSPFYRKIALFENQDKGLGLRIFPTQNPKTLMNSLTTQVLKGRILIHLDHKTVPPPITGVPKVDEVVAKVKVRNDVADPVSMMTIAKESKKADNENEAAMPDVSQLLADKLIYIAGFFAVLLVALLASLLIRRLASKTEWCRKKSIATP